jgi:hypothetical protein
MSAVIALYVALEKVMLYVVKPLLKISVYVVAVSFVLSFCLIISGFGGSILFYILLLIYIYSIFTYRPLDPNKNNAVN